MGPPPTPERQPKVYNLTLTKQALRIVLAGDFVCASPNDTDSGYFSAGSLVPQEASDLRRCARFDTQGVIVGTGGGDFPRVVRGHRHGKSPTGICGTTNRRGLLCSLMAKVALQHHLGRT